MSERTLEILGDLVGYPTVSSDPNLDLIDYVVALMEKAGARTAITTDETGEKANVLASFGPKADEGLVLSGHTDVVPVEGQEWTRHPFRLEVEGSRAWGRGATDMKGFIACVLATVEDLSLEDLKRPLHVALTYEEEVGCHGAPVLLADLERQGFLPSVAIVGEPTEMRVAVAHKGCYEYTTTFTSTEQHGSLGTKGAGAISAAGRYVGMLDQVAEELMERAPSDSLFDTGSTINIGTIRGGVARNITPGSVVMEWEVRPVRSDDQAYVWDRVERFVAEDLLPDIREVFPTATVETTSIGGVDGLFPEPDGEAAALARRVTGSEPEAVPFCTEAGLFQRSGISTVVCGPGNIQQAHKPDEYIEIAQLQSCLTATERLIESWCTR